MTNHSYGICLATLSKAITYFLDFFERNYSVVCSDLKVNKQPVHVCVCVRVCVWVGVLREDKRIPTHSVWKCFSRDSDNTRDVF